MGVNNVENNRVRLRIDGREVIVPEGTYITHAAEMHGVDIPVFCGHEKFKPWAGCRMCLVEVGLPRSFEEDGKKVTRVQKIPKLQAACSMPVSEGMEVWTDTETVVKNRKSVLEFLLINHPLECPVCDKGGECPLQDITYKYGLGESRMKEPKRVIPDTDVNEFVRLNYKRCIHCKLCVRFHDEVAGDHLLEFGGRGAQTFIQPGEGRKSKFSGNQVEFCPVGALTSKPYRFKSRDWEQVRTPSVCTGCSVGCNIEIHHRMGEIHRLWSRDNPEVDWGWLCDKGRFVYEQLYHEDRIRKPLVRDESGEFVERSWGWTSKYIADNLKRIIDRDGRESISGIAGSRLTNETYGVFRQLLVSHVGTARFHFGPYINGLDDNLQPFLSAVVFDSTSWEKVTKSDVILAWGVDLLEEAPVLGLKVERDLEAGGALLLTAASHVTESERMASASYHYPIRRQADALRMLINGVANPSDALEELKPLLEYLGGAKTIAVLIGSEVLSSPEAALLIDLLLKLCHNLKVKVEEEVGALERDEGVTPSVTFNPIFRDGNSLGAIFINYLARFFTTDEAEFKGELYSLDAILTGMAAGESEFCYVIGADPVKNFPDSKLARNAFEHAEFIVVQDQFLTETAKYANVILPALTALEQEGTVFSSEKRLQKLNSPGVRAGLADSDFHILHKIMIEMGVRPHSVTVRDHFKTFSDRIPSLSVIEYDSIPPSGILLEFGEVTEEGEPPAPGEYLSVDAPENLDEPAGREDSLMVLIPKHLHFAAENHSMHSEHFREAIGEAFCEVNPADAERLELDDGQMIEIASRAGGIEVTLKITTRVPFGHVLVSDSLPGLRFADLLTLGEHTVVNLIPVNRAMPVIGGD